jgi:membrane-bound ClpP family serine protease
VVEDIPANGPGKVEFHGTRWEAEAAAPIACGATVKITGNKNITLIVENI